MDGNRQFDRTERGQTILKEDAPDRGAERFKADATVLSVVLDVAKLRRTVNAGIRHEAKRGTVRYAEHKHGSLPAIGSRPLRLFLHVEEKTLGEGHGVVGRVGNHIVAK